MIMGIRKLTHFGALKFSSLRSRSSTSENAKNQVESPIQRREREQQLQLEGDKQEFRKR